MDMSAHDEHEFSPIHDLRVEPTVRDVVPVVGHPTYIIMEDKDVTPLRVQIFEGDVVRAIRQEGKAETVEVKDTRRVEHPEWVLVFPPYIDAAVGRPTPALVPHVVVPLEHRERDSALTEGDDQCIGQITHPGRRSLWLKAIPPEDNAIGFLIDG